MKTTKKDESCERMVDIAEQHKKPTRVPKPANKFNKNYLALLLSKVNKAKLEEKTETNIINDKYDRDDRSVN